MASAIEEDFEDILNCQICLEQLDDPRSLSCLHTYCRSCIQAVYDIAVKKDPETARYVSCPLGCAKTKLPSEDVAHLPKHFYTDKVKAIATKSRSLGRSSTASDSIIGVCGDCRYDDVVFYCFECTEALCKQCGGTHDEHERYRDHTKVEVLGSGIETFVCDEHNKYYEAYCVDDHVMVCKSCQRSSHKGHKVDELCLKQSPNRDPFLDELESMQLNLDHREKRVRYAELVFDDMISTTRNKIAKHKKFLIMQLDEQERKMCDELVSYQSITHALYTNTGRQIRQSKEQLNSIQKKAMLLSSPVPENQTLGVKKQHEYVNRIKNSLPRLDFHTHEPDTFTFTPSIDEMVLGYFTRSCHVDDHTTRNVAQKANDRKIKSQSTTWFTSSEALSTISEPYQIPKIVWSEQTSGIVLDIACFVEGDIFTLEKASATHPVVVHMYNSDGKQIECTLKVPSGSRSIHKLNNIATHQVTKQIVLTHSSTAGVSYTTGPELHGNFTLFNKSKGHWTSKTFPIDCATPGSVAFSPATGDIVLVKDQRHSILMYSQTGERKWKHKTSHECHHLAVNSKGQVIVSDMHHVFIYAVSQKSCVKTFASSTSLRISGITLDSNDNILLSDSKKLAIVKLAQERDRVSTVVTLKDEPKVTTICGHNRLLVVSQGEKGGFDFFTNYGLEDKN